MSTLTGTYDISALLATRNASAAEFGLDTIQAVLQADIAAHNAIVLEMVSELCEVTPDRQRIYGTSTDGEMVEVDEYGRAPTQRPVTGATVGFPMRLFQYSIGWTRKWFETRTPADMAQAVLGAESAHLRAIQREIKKAIFLSTNYTFKDFLVDNVSLAVKRLVNADSADIPDGPNGETFDGASHDHYNANATLTAVALLASVEDVIEHGHGGMVKLAINKANEAAVRLLSGFTAYPDPRLVMRATDAPGETLDISRLDNRAIGIFSGAEVWVKPWCPAGYYLAWDAASPNKPLVFRQRSATSLQGLRIAADIDDYALYAQYMEAEYGIGVWTRTNGAVLYVGGESYVDPTIS
jgi:hypothetical protein